MGCLLQVLGFASGFGLTFWLIPVFERVFFDGDPEWYLHWPVSVFVGLVAAGMLESMVRKAREDDLIRRADVKRAEEYLNRRNTPDDEN